MDSQDTVLYTKAYIEEKADNEVTAIASTAVEDRQGDVVEVDGWDLKDFKNNPVILWGHDHTQPAIGKATKTWVDGSGKSAKLMVKIAFQQVTELGRAITQLVNEGFVNTLSVGFQPIEAEGNVYTKQKLLEVSVVNVPANPQALMLGYKSLKEAGFDNETITKAGYPSSLMDELSDLKQEMAIMKGQIDSAVNGLKHLNPHTGRDSRITKDRLNMTKVIVRAADQHLSNSSNDSVRTAKIIKKAGDQLIVSLKGELDGQNQRTASKARERGLERG